MNILVLQACDSNLKDQKEISSPAWQSYCEKHGYDYLFIDKELGDDIGFLIIQKSIIDVLNGDKEYDWIFWADIDTLPINKNIKLELFVDDSYDIIISELVIKFGYEFNGKDFIKSETGSVTSYNTGSMLVKKSDFSLHFMTYIVNFIKLNKMIIDPFVLTILGDEIPFIILRSEHEDVFDKHIKIIPLDDVFATPIESYIRTKRFLLNTKQFDGNDFILHASRDHNKATILKKYADYPHGFYDIKLLRVFDINKYFDDRYIEKLKPQKINFFNINGDTLPNFLKPQDKVYYTTYDVELAKKIYNDGHDVELLIKKGWVDLQNDLPNYEFKISLVIMFENHDMTAIKETCEYLNKIKDKLFNVYFFNNRTKSFLRSSGALNEIKFSLGIYKDIIKNDFVTDEFKDSYCPILGNYVGYFGNKISLCECDMLGSYVIKPYEYISSLLKNFNYCATNNKRYCRVAPCVFEV